MKKLVYKFNNSLDNYHTEAYSDDIDTLVLECYKAGYDIDRRDAQLAWEEHSENWAAGWLSLTFYDEIVDFIKESCDEVEIFDLDPENRE